MKRDLLVTVTLLAVGMLTVMSGAIVVTALNDLAAHFAGSQTQNANLRASLILVMPALGIVISAPLMGWVADRHGRWRTLAVSVPALKASGASGYWKDRYVLLLIARLVLGSAIAGVTVSATSILGALSAEEKRQDLLGKQSAFINLSGMTYLLLGGLLAREDWRLPFLLYLWPIVLMPLVVLSMRAQPIAINAPKMQAADWRLLLKHPSLTSVLLVWSLGGVSMAIIYTLFTVHPFRMKELGFEDPRFVSSTIMAATASSAVTGWNLRRISVYLSPYAIFVIAFVMFGLGLIAVSVASEVWHVIGGNLIMEIGMGLPVPNGSSWLSSISPDAVRGRILGQFMSPLLLSSVALISDRIFVANAAIGVLCLSIACVMLTVSVSRGISLRGARESQVA